MKKAKFTQVKCNCDCGSKRANKFLNGKVICLACGSLLQNKRN